MDDFLKSAVIDGLKLISFHCQDGIDIYALAARRYLLFWQTEINKTNMSSVLEEIAHASVFSKIEGWKTFIVIGNTSDVFQSQELFWFDGENTFVVFYLVNSHHKKIYLNKKRIYPLGLGYRSFVKKIHTIVSSAIAL